MVKIKEGISSNGKKLHYSVGALISKNGKYLLIDRAREPYGYAPVAGHIDEDEDAELAIRREVFEEVGLYVKKVHLVLHGELENNVCGKGADVHEWWVYNVRCEGELKIDKKEVRAAEWYSKKEIKKLKLAPAFTDLLKRLKIVY